MSLSGVPPSRLLSPLRLQKANLLRAKHQVIVMYITIRSQYVNSHLSTHYSITVYGAGFPAFVAKQPSAFVADASELAQFDWALERVTEKVDAPVLSFSALSNIAPEDWPRVYFTLHPSVLTFTVNHDVVACWQALQDSKTALQAFAKPALCVVWCSDKVHSCYWQLHDNERIIFELFQAGQHFSDVCEHLLEYFPEECIAPTIIDCLRQWLDNGMFSTFDLR